jgi:hypothetical protein
MRVSLLAWVTVLGLVGCEELTVSSQESSAEEPRLVADDGLTKVISPSADAYVRSGSNANKNFGSRASLLADLDDAGAQEIAYIKFAVPAFAGLVSAKLRLYVTNASGAGPDLVAVPSTSWSENSITWNTRPAAGTVIANLGPRAASTWVEVDVTALVRSGAPMALALVPRSADALIVSSKEATGNRPQLILVTVSCGDGTCDAGETCSACALDCGACPAGPWGGSPVALPGTIAAAHFDLGGEGVAYHDTSAGNFGDATFRNPTDVDLKTNGGSYTVGWFAPGEWLNYTVKATTAGSYIVRLRVASGDVDGGALRVFVGGADATGAVTVPNTGAYETFTTLEAPISLAAGVQVLRVMVEQSWFDLDTIEVAAGLPPDEVAPSITIVDPGAGVTVSGTVTLRGTASDDVELSEVQLQVDTRPAVTPVGLGAWSLSLDTTQLSNGAHTLTARAIDASGNAGTATRAFTVDNSAPTPDPVLYPVGTYDGNGNVFIVDTNYAIPAGAYYVATTGGDGGSGSLTSPWRTLQKAVSSAPNGATIVLREGTYRESASFSSKKLTIQPYPHEKVWMKGSLVVTGWVQEGSIWRKDGWTYELRSDADSRAIDPNFPMAGHPDQVFVDGKALKQVGSLSGVGSGSFFVDYATDKLYIGANPSGHQVEATAYKMGLVINNASGSIVRGLGFAHYGPGYDPAEKGALRVTGSGVQLLDNTFAWNATQGFLLLGPDAVVRGNTMAYNGLDGGGGYKADRILFERNAIAYNNQEHYKTSWAAAGSKSAGMRNGIWRDNLVEKNLAHGLWCDIDCYDNVYVRNTLRDNQGHGIFYEISDTAIIASNLFVRNNFGGVKVGAGSRNVRVWNNTFSRNTINFYVVDDNRVSSDPARPWDTLNVTFRNNLVSNGSSSAQSLFEVVDFTGTKRSGEQMNVDADYDAYYRSTSSAPATLVRWQKTTAMASYSSLDAFRAGTGREAHGRLIENQSANPFFVDESAGNFRLKAGSVALGAGIPLPADIALAVGVPSGAPVDLGALRW